jgi:chromosome segregation ATPase
VSEKQENNILTQDVQQLEDTLRGLWDKTRQAADMIQSLRNENRSLQENVGGLEAKIDELQAKLEQRNDEVQLMQQQLRDIRSNGLGLLDQTQKAELREQIVSLINKINSHL